MSTAATAPFGRNKFWITLLGSLMASAAMEGHTQTPQISEGVRAMMSVGTNKFGPQESRYMVVRQPPLYDHLPPGTIRFFNAEPELISFFEELPPTLRSRGLWVTRAGPPGADTAEDRQHVTQLVDEANRKRVLVYLCVEGLMGACTNVRSDP